MQLAVVITIYRVMPSLCRVLLLSLLLSLYLVPCSRAQSSASASASANANAYLYVNYAYGYYDYGPSPPTNSTIRPPTPLAMTIPPVNNSVTPASIPPMRVVNASMLPVAVTMPPINSTFDDSGYYDYDPVAIPSSNSASATATASATASASANVTVVAAGNYYYYYYDIGPVNTSTVHPTPMNRSSGGVRPSVVPPSGDVYYYYEYPVAVPFHYYDYNTRARSRHHSSSSEESLQPRRNGCRVLNTTRDHNGKRRVTWWACGNGSLTSPTGPARPPLNCTSRLHRYTTSVGRWNRTGSVMAQAGRPVPAGRVRFDAPVVNSTLPADVVSAGGCVGGYRLVSAHAAYTAMGAGKVVGNFVSYLYIVKDCY